MIENEIQALDRMLDRLDYYQLLEIPHQAKVAEIKSAYFERSMEFHPDRFVRHPDDQLKRRIYAVYKRVSEAFRVLSRSDTRAEYDAELARPGGGRSLRYRNYRTRDEPRAEDHAAAAARTPAGRRYLQFAQLAREQGNLHSARMYLSLAVQCEPTNATLREWLEAAKPK